MTADDGHFRFPPQSNEPIRPYAPGDATRKSLKGTAGRVDRCARTDVLMQIGEERRWGASKADIHSPHRKSCPSLGSRSAAARTSTTRLRLNARGAANMGNHLVSGEGSCASARGLAAHREPWRDTINAATMLGQSKTVHQAEIDAACESIDFWRYNVRLRISFTRGNHWPTTARHGTGSSTARSKASSSR